MRIETDNCSKSRIGRRKRILIEVIVGIAIVVGALCLISKPLSAQIKQTWAKISHTKNITADLSEKQVLDSVHQIVNYQLDSVHYDNYIEIALSKKDVYKVEFINEDSRDYIIINTKSRLDESDIYLYMVPDHIATRGYDSIVVSALYGDGNYWVDFVATLKDPNLADYKDHNIVDFEIKKLDIQISEDDMLKLTKKRDEAVALKILLGSENDYVPATVCSGGNHYDADIRLKGDWTDHFNTNKWSFRIKLHKDSLWGMKKFSIHRPESRKGESEYVIHALYKQNGGVSLRYSFIDVIINGEYKGVYAVEENFDKITVEHSLKREGPILKFSEDAMWTGQAYYLIQNHTEFENSFVDIFELGKTLENDVLLGYTKYAVDNLNRYIKGEINADEVFDLDLYARYFAVLDTLCSSHGTVWFNMRYYYNPLTAKLEPITFDELMLNDGVYFHPVNTDPIIQSLYEDDIFFKLYVKYLKENLLNYDTFIEQEKDTISQSAYIVSRGYYNFKDSDYYHRKLDAYHDRLNQILYNYDNIFTGVLKKEKLNIYFDPYRLGFINIIEISYQHKKLDIQYEEDGIVIDTATLDDFKQEDIADIVITFIRKDTDEVCRQSVITLE